MTKIESQAVVRFAVQLVLASAAYIYTAGKIDGWPGWITSGCLLSLAWKIAWDGPARQVKTLEEREMKQWLKTVT